MATKTPSRRGRRRSPAPLIVTVAVVVAALGVLALALTGGDDAEGDRAAFGTVTVSGQALPRYDGDAGADPALGQPAPAIEGHDFDAAPAAVEWDDGRPKVLLFLAHWCPACQAEVPLVVDAVDDGAIPDGVDVVGVTTGTDRSAPNFPPSEWLEDEGWTLPVIVDDADNSAALAFGLSAYPFFVMIDGDGEVAGRFAGQIGKAEFERLLVELEGTAGDG